jgi:hypothetical protein
LRTKFSLPTLTFFQTQPVTIISPFLHSQTFTMSSPLPTSSPNSKVNPPSAHCIKPTKQMAAYFAATPGDFAAPCDADKNVVYLFAYTSLNVAKPNTSTKIETPKVKSTKKSSEPAPPSSTRSPMVLTPEQESAIISRSIIIVN